jgi:mannose-1-phosphate guanylyltransferase
MDVNAGSAAGRSAIVLAGGDGIRLQAFTRQWLGDARPKQYCTFVGTRSMLDHTLDRAAQWCEPSRIVSVAGVHHGPLIESRPVRRTDGRVVFQPTNCGTAPGLLLGLSHVLHEAPDSIVAVFPSDHFVYPEWRFLCAIRSAAAAAQALPDRLVLLGVPAANPEDEYGWILPREQLLRVDGRPVFSVGAFLEKPAPGQARVVQRAGAVWNTFVIVARAQTLWDVTSRHLEAIAGRFTRLRAAIGTPSEQAVLADIYAAMPFGNFSSDVLECGCEHSAVMTMEGLTWSDWGRPERIIDTLVTCGLRPSFPMSGVPVPVKAEQPQAAARADYS